ncbi:COG4315 family predicted lipoprotein [Pseudomonas fluorescens]|uniref:COG4315 family predicted lipoprotein n=1 Tax=Pseudomonas TaxID=286 RepID=UPI003D04577B
MTHYAQSFKALMLAAALALPAMAFAADPATEKGGMLVDSKGMTLYTFAKDAAGKSMCNDACAANWPPLAATAMDKSKGDWTVIKRADGKMQWAYYGKPLYTFVKDKKAGDMTGEGLMDGAWHVAKPM